MLHWPLVQLWQWFLFLIIHLCGLKRSFTLVSTPLSGIFINSSIHTLNEMSKTQRCNKLFELYCTFKQVINDPLNALPGVSYEYEFEVCMQLSINHMKAWERAPFFFNNNKSKRARCCLSETEIIKSREGDGQTSCLMSQQTEDQLFPIRITKTHAKNRMNPSTLSLFAHTQTHTKKFFFDMFAAL